MDIPNNEVVECGRGISFVTGYCASGERKVIDPVLCLNGQFLICRFCTHLNDDQLSSSINVNATLFRHPLKCQGLYDMKPGELRTRISEEYFDLVKKSLTDRLEKIVRSIVQMRRTVMIDTINQESEVSRRARAIEELRRLIKGRGGLRETLDHLGVSQSSTAMSAKFNQIDREIYSPFETLANSMRSEEEFNEWAELGDELMIAYSLVREEIINNFIFSPSVR